MRVSCVVLVLAVCACAGRPQPTLTPASQSVAMPSVAFPLLDGGTFASDEVRGTVLVLDVWATYCVPCKKAFPRLSRLAAARPEVRVVGLSIDEGDAGDEAVRRFLAEVPAGFPIARDRDERALAAPLRIAKVPTLFVVDGAGRVRLRLEEPAEADYDALLALIDELGAEAR